jgi:hypothetical protein
MGLLQNPADQGYPIEYLLSRIKGRRSGLIRDWKRLIYDAALFESAPSPKTSVLMKAKTPDGVWGNLIREYRWVYGQMNRQLREIFGPFFLYSELRTLFICLRRLEDRKAGVLDELLNRSLLSDEMKQVLFLSSDLKAAVSGIERLFAASFKKTAGLTAVLEAEGLRGVEQRLVEWYLAVTAGSSLHPFMKLFFSRLIDARNSLSLYKYLRLELKAMPPVIPGGLVPEARLLGIAKKGDLVEVGKLIEELSGVPVERPDPTLVELALYRGMTKWLKKAGREPFGVAPILDYLWRCSIEAMNLSVLYHGKDLEREAVTAELVLRE